MNCSMCQVISVVVQLLSHVWLFATPWTTARQASLSFTISWSLPKLMSIESVMSSNYFFLCCPLLLLPSIFPSIRVFSNESVLCIRWPKYWSFSISPSNEYSGLISFRIDWFDLLAVQVTLMSPTPQDWRNRLREGTNKTLCSPGPTRDWTRRACECPGVSGRGVGQQWQAAGPGALNTTVLGAVTWWHRSFWRRSPYHHCKSCSVMSDSLWLHGLYSPWNSLGQNTGVGSLSLLQGIFPTQRLNPGLLHYRQILYHLRHKGSPLLPLTLALGPTTGREHSPAYQQKIGLKIYWAWPCPPEQEPGLLTAGTSQSGNFHKPLILIHQRADRTKPPSQKTNQNWSRGSQPCLTQWDYEPCHVGPCKMDGSWWTVLTKCGPLEKGMANHFSILALRTPWTVWKGKNLKWSLEQPISETHWYHQWWYHWYHQWISSRTFWVAKTVFNIQSATINQVGHGFKHLKRSKVLSSWINHTYFCHVGLLYHCYFVWLM